MNAVTVVASAVSNWFMDVLVAEVFCAMAGKAWCRGFTFLQHRILALVVFVAATAHSDFERTMFFPAHQFISHMALKTEAGRGFREQFTDLWVMGLMARRASSARYRLVAVLGSRKRLFIVAFITEIRFFCLQEHSAIIWLMRSVASETIALLNRSMNDAA
jgi:hypothetical protein